MKVDLINTGNYEIYRRHNHSDRQSNDSKTLHNPQSKSKVHKEVMEGELLNPGRTNTKVEINPQYRHNAPVARSSETFDAVFEMIEEEIATNPVSADKLLAPGKLIVYPKTEKSGSNDNRLGKGYIISVRSDRKQTDKRDYKMLKAQKRLFDKYNRGNWRQPGMLVNLSF